MRYASYGFLFVVMNGLYANMVVTVIPRSSGVQFFSRCWASSFCFTLISIIIPYKYRRLKTYIRMSSLKQRRIGLSVNYSMSNKSMLQ